MQNRYRQAGQNGNFRIKMWGGKNLSEFFTFPIIIVCS